MVQALVITPVLAEIAFSDIVQRIGVETCDVVATAGPLADLGAHIRDGATVGGVSIRGQVFDAVKLSLEAHKPKEVYFLLTDNQTEGALRDLRAFEMWMRANGFYQDLQHRHIEGTMPPLRTIGLTCIDWRLSAALTRVKPETTGWLRLPGVESSFANPETREEIFAELSRATGGGILTRTVSVRVDPHQDCAARSMRNRRAGESDAEWYVRDLMIMKAEHKACQEFLRSTQISRTNPSLRPVRAFGKSGDGDFTLRQYDTRGTATPFAP